MAYDSQHQLLTMSGVSWGGAEEFSFSFRISNPALPTQDDVDFLAAAAETMFESAGMAIDPQHQLTSLKLAPIAVNGEYPPGANSKEHLFSGVFGGGGAQHWPAQCTVAVTLTTALPRGYASKGRFYLPSQTIALGANGRLPNASIVSMNAALKTWLDSVNNSLVGDISVFSQGNAAEGVAPSHQKVTAIRVGDIVDTQRRRRRQFVENYVATALA